MQEQENNYDFVIIDDQNTWAKIATLMMFKLGLKQFRISEEDKESIKQANPSMLCKFEGDDFVMTILTQEEAEEMKRMQEAEQAYATNLAEQEAQMLKDA